MELPIIYRLNLIKDFGLKVYGGLGIGISMVETAFWNYYDPKLSNMPILQNYQDEYFKNTRVFLPLGLAYDFPFGLSIDIGYALNINDMKGNIRAEKFAQGVDSFHVGAAFIFGARKNKTEF